MRYEATRVGQDDASLWPHLAADPERILEIAVQYMHFGLYSEAVDLLARKYPSGEDVVSEPGMPPPEQYPLMAYYRGYCRDMLHQGSGSDYAVASKMSTVYAFPNRTESLDVLKRAISANPKDANAHSLLGSLYMAGGMEEAAMAQWKAARELNPAIPALLRNMGYTAPLSQKSPERAIQYFEEGTKAEPANAENYLGLEQALRQAGRSPQERAEALQKFQGDRPPSNLVFQLARDLADAGRYEDAQAELAKQFVSREEGGVGVLDVYLDVKLKQTQVLVDKKQCAEAKQFLEHLSDPVPQLSLTKDALTLALQSARIRKAIAEVESSCAR